MTDQNNQTGCNWANISKDLAFLSVWFPEAGCNRKWTEDKCGVCLCSRAILTHTHPPYDATARYRRVNHWDGFWQFPFKHTVVTQTNKHLVIYLSTNQSPLNWLFFPELFVQNTEKFKFECCWSQNELTMVVVTSSTMHLKWFYSTEIKGCMLVRMYCIFIMSPFSRMITPEIWVCLIVRLFNTNVWVTFQLCVSCCGVRGQVEVCKPVFRKGNGQTLGVDL